MSAIWGRDFESEGVMREKVKQYFLCIWHELPPKYQALAVVVSAAAVTAVGKTLAATLLDADHPCFHWVCVRHALGSSIGAGVTAGYIAYKAFFMRPGPGKPAWEKPAQQAIEIREPAAQ